MIAIEKYIFVLFGDVNRSKNEQKEYVSIVYLTCHIMYKILKNTLPANVKDAGVTFQKYRESHIKSHQITRRTISEITIIN